MWDAYNEFQQCARASRCSQFSGYPKDDYDIVRARGLYTLFQQLSSTWGYSQGWGQQQEWSYQLRVGEFDHRLSLHDVSAAGLSLLSFEMEPGSVEEDRGGENEGDGYWDRQTKYGL